MWIDNGDRCSTRVGGTALVAGYRVQVSGFRLQVTGFRVQVTSYRFQGSSYRLQVSGFRLQGSGFRVAGVQGSGGKNFGNLGFERIIRVNGLGNKNTDRL